MTAFRSAHGRSQVALAAAWCLGWIALSALPVAAGPALDAFLARVRQVVAEPVGPIGIPRPVVGPDFLSSDYARQAVSLRVQEAVQNGRAGDPEFLRNEIRDARRAAGLLQRSREGTASLEDLAELHPLIQVSRNELEVVFALAVALMKAGYPLDDARAVFSYLRQVEPMFMMNSEMPDIDPLALESERLAWLARAGPLTPADEEALARIRREHPFEPALLYNAACVLSLTGRVDEARDLLLRISLLDPQMGERASQDTDLAKVMADEGFRQILASGTGRPSVGPGTFPGIDRLEIDYSWGGMGEPVRDRRVLVWKDDRFIEEASGTAIPADLVGELRTLAEAASPSADFVSRITHYDDYPHLKMVAVRPGKEPVRFISDSNAPGMLPFNVVIDGQLRAIHDRRFAEVLGLMSRWLELRRGVPRASYHFGGSEIAVESGRKPSQQEQEARVEMGLPPLPPPASQADLPPELAGLAGWRLQRGLHTFIPAEDGRPEVHFERFVLLGSAPVGVAELEVLTVRIRLGARERWFLGEPGRLPAIAQELVPRLAELMGSVPGRLSVRPAVRSFSPSGDPGFSDLSETFESLARVGASFPALGGELVPLLVRAGSDSVPGRIEAFFLPASAALIIRDFEQTKGPFDGRLALMLLAWAGCGPEIASHVSVLSLRNDMVYLGLSASAPAEIDRRVRDRAGNAGRKVQVNDSRGAWSRFMIKPADEGKLFLLQEAGKPPRLQHESPRPRR